MQKHLPAHLWVQAHKQLQQFKKKLNKYKIWQQMAT